MKEHSGMYSFSLSVYCMLNNKTTKVRNNDRTKQQKGDAKQQKGRCETTNELNELKYIVITKFSSVGLCDLEILV